MNFNDTKNEEKLKNLNGCKKIVKRRALFKP